MKKCTAYRMSREEAQENLQVILDNKGIKLVKQNGFYEAESDIQYLDGSEVDERMAQILNVQSCEHFSDPDGKEMFVIVNE